MSVECRSIECVFSPFLSMTVPKIMTQMDSSINVLGGPMRSCSHAPKTGWFRDGCCNTNDHDKGSHTVCAIVTTDFLRFLKARGNDLMTPAPQHGFPGLKDGD